MNIRTITTAIIIVILCAGFVVSNRMSYQDGLDDQAFKCAMIEEGAWPDVDDFKSKNCE